MVITIDLPKPTEGQAYATTYNTQPDGTTVQVTVPAGICARYTIQPDWEGLTRCKRCKLHQKVPGCSGPCPFCAAGNLCKCKGDPDDSYWYEGRSCGAKPGKRCKALRYFDEMCQPCKARV